MNEERRGMLVPAWDVAWAMGVVGTLAVMAILVVVMMRSTRPEDLAAARLRERLQFREEVRSAEAQSTSRYAWQDRERGVVRIPVDRAMELVIREWQDPALARSNLMERVAIATLPPPEPESLYE